MFSYGQQQQQQQPPPPPQQQQLPQQMLAGAIDPIPLPIQSPTSKEQVQRYFLRYQALKAQFGEPNNNDEFNELKRILTEFSARQAQMHRNRQMLQQQQGQSPQMHQQSPQPQSQPPQQQQQPQQQPRLQPQRNVQMQGVSPQMAASPMPTAPQQAMGNGQQPQQQSRAPSMGNIPGTPQASSAFTQDQIAMLRSQLMVCKALYKKQPPPVQSLAHIFPNEYTQLQFQPASPAQQQSPSVPQIPGAPSVMAASPQAVPQQQPQVAPPAPPQAQVQQFQNPQHSPSSVTTNRQSRTPSISSPVVVPPQHQPQPLASQVATPPQVVIPQAPEPKTNVEKLGVKAAVDPWSYIADEVPFDNLIARQKQLFVPTIMPHSLDAVKMKETRERMINDAMAARIHELVKYETNDESQELDEDTVNKLVELKSLRLVNYNKALKGDLASQIYYFNTIGIDETNRQQYTRMRRPQLQDALITENFDREQQRVRMQSLKKQRTLHLENLQKHCHSLIESNKARKTRQLKLGKLMVQYHHTTEKEEQKRIERTAKQRLQALRANDEEAYIKLLDQTKDTRITHLLKQTNTFLSSLAEAVKTQQAESKGIRGVADEEADAADFDDEDNEKIDYYAVAHRIKEEVTKQPSILVGGTLKEYQIKGLQWMVSLYNNNLNGILADEMGLGKTIQTISLITYLIEVKKHPGPYLVIVPLSTLTNWTLEFEKWAPTVKKIVYKGPPPVRKQQQAAIRSGDFQVLLTTYEYIIKDRPILSRIRWIHMIIDEGHRMKNAQSKLSYTLTTYYSSKYRLILTGTPLQNNLPELWALLNFALPKIFNSVKSFDEWFNTPFANTGAQDKMDLSEEETLLIIRRLHKVLRPFLLRRLKKDVEKDLPDKVEKVIKCKMSTLQVKLYQQMLKYKMLFLGEGAQGASSQGGVKGLNNTIMQLRKICNHPYVFEEVESLINPTKQNGDDLWRAAGKFELLDRILPKFKATGHRVLMFFQMTQIMDIMEDFLRCKGLQYLRLDGSTKADERSDLLKVFNAEDSPYFAFLLSTRAGGLGLNLQTADTVIIYDTDWNPHQDLQAQDRAHRIGQTKEVRILRLITENSVEENILERAHAKLEIDGKVIQAGKFDNKSTNEEQEAFLRSLLEAEDARRGQKEEEDEDLNDEELNNVLARSEEERELFRQLDIERNANDPWRGRRLMVEEELPEVYQKESYDQYIEPEPIENYGRGTRERKIMHYDDGLTEEQWLEAVDDDNDTLEDAIARKRARQAKRKKNLGSESPIPIVPDSPPVTASAKKKRGRKPKEQVDDIPTMPPRKKAKGRPPKLKETLTPEQRLDLTTKARAIFEAVVSLQDEGRGRPRIELFLELPSKKLYPDYYVLIKDPIACDLIEKRINNNTYQSIKAFLDDFNVMFKNARIYNEEGSIVYEDANELERVMREKCAELGVPLEVPPPPPPPPVPAAPIQQQPLLENPVANDIKPVIVPNDDFSKPLQSNPVTNMLPTTNGHTTENGDLLNGSDSLGAFDADFHFDHGEGDGDDDFRPDDNDDDLLNDFS